MNTPLCLALFDCDGTLVDSQHLIVGAMTKAWNAVGMTAPDPALVRRVVGLPLVQAMAVLLPDGSPQLHEELTDRYKVAYFEQRQLGDEVEPLYPGLVEALDALESTGIILGVATGKSRRGLIATLDRHGLLDRFVTLQTSDIGYGKPHPDMVFRALKETGVEAADTIVIGDTTFDMLMARNARVRAIGVSWGYHDETELIAAGAARICHRYSELPGAVVELLDNRK
jgi:phosphoglycolate phosphatase